jgi:hypothetical protein
MSYCSSCWMLKMSETSELVHRFQNRCRIGVLVTVTFLTWNYSRYYKRGKHIKDGKTFSSPNNRRKSRKRGKTMSILLSFLFSVFSAVKYSFETNYWMYLNPLGLTQTCIVDVFWNRSTRD